MNKILKSDKAKRILSITGLVLIVVADIALTCFCELRYGPHATTSKKGGE